MSKLYKSRDDRAARESMRGMSWRGKIDYLWSYYKMQIIGGALVLGVLLWVLNAYVLNPPKKLYVSLAVYGPYVGEDATVAFEARLDGLVPAEETDSKRGFVYTYNINGSDMEYQYAMVQQFYALIWTGDLDVVITTPDSLPSMAVSDALKPLDEALPPSVRETIDDGRLVYANPKNSATDTAYGIRLTGKAAELLPGMPDATIAFVNGTPRTDEAMKAFLALLNWNE